MSNVVSSLVQGNWADIEDVDESLRILIAQGHMSGVFYFHRQRLHLWGKVSTGAFWVHLKTSWGRFWRHLAQILAEAGVINLALLWQTLKLNQSAYCSPIHVAGAVYTMHCNIHVHWIWVFQPSWRQTFRRTTPPQTTPPQKLHPHQTKVGPPTSLMLNSAPAKSP